MRILVVSDEPCKALWDYFDKSRLQDVDLILSCGDLPAAYLSFLVTFSDCPVLYVHGNHDDRYEAKPPEGCECIDDTLYVYNGVRILGLGGSYRYNDGIHQYTEKEMERRWKKMRSSINKYGGVDILLTHAPALGVNDQEDLPHRGFGTFLTMIDTYKPSYMIHGHVHMTYGYQIPRETDYHGTSIINGYERYYLDYTQREDAPPLREPKRLFDWIKR